MTSLKDRYRMIEADDRTKTIGLAGALVVADSKAAFGLWIEVWMMILFELLALSLILTDRRIPTNPRLSRAGVWALMAWVLSNSVAVVISGGPRSPAIPMMVMPVGMVAARFRWQTVIAALALTIAATLAATVGVHPQWAIDDPGPLIAKLALMTTVVAIVAGLRAARLLHGDESILDPLTGLLNRNGLGPRFVVIAHEARLTGRPVSMIVCDVDDLKAINHEFGRAHSDAVLRDVARELRNSMRPYERIYRLWGGTFMIALPGIPLQAATFTAARLRETVAQARPAGVAITISLGVSAASGALVDFDDLLETAGEALYAAKRSGRNCVAARHFTRPKRARRSRVAALCASPDAGRVRRVSEIELSYCVVNTSQRELLVSGLDAIARDREGLPFATEVLVLDNGSRDGSAQAAREHPTVDQTVVLDRRQGKALNDSELLRSARGRYALLLNEDSELRPGATLALWRALEGHPRAACAGAQLLRPDGSRQACAWRFPTPWTALAGALMLHRRLTVQSRGNRVREVDWCQSSALLVRRRAAEEVGYLDSRFFVYSDEVDFARRLRDAGWHSLYVPDATAVHHEQLSTGAVPERRIVELARNRDLYMRKHHSAAAARAVRWLTAYGYALRALAALALPGHSAHRYWRHVTATLFPGRGEGLREAAAEYNRRSG
jgi:N-acetylglucosaminyl-diphospho-decaprenol L-rhamnosyltransferase